MLVLCIDAGGTKCTSVVADLEGNVVGRGTAGPCNYASIGLDSTLAAISSAFSAILPKNGILVGAWIGIAGADRPEDRNMLLLPIAGMLNLAPQHVTLTSDASLLCARPNSVAVVVGTGSIAYAGDKRAGGWGYLLGDEGSGYAVGRASIRAALCAKDMGMDTSPLHRALLDHFECDSVDGIIPRVYSKGKGAIAETAKLVFDLAFRDEDEEAWDIVNEAAIGLARTITILLKGGVNASDRTLVMGGSLSQAEGFRTMVVEEIGRMGHVFAAVEPVLDAKDIPLQMLAEKYRMLLA